MNTETPESTPAPVTRQARKRRSLPNDVRTEQFNIRISIRVLERLQNASERLGLDASTLAFNILRYATSKETLTDEEYLEFSRNRANSRGFVLWEKGA